MYNLKTIIIILKTIIYIYNKDIKIFRLFDETSFDHFFFWNFSVKNLFLDYFREFAYC